MYYKIKDIEWDKQELLPEGKGSGYARLYSKNKLLYAYELYRFYDRETGVWSQWILNVIWPKYVYPKIAKTFQPMKSLEEGILMANRHNTDAIKEYLEEVGE